eukprot:TRINITY_DN3308_c0_g1_i1.p1 TRINITY_DN3308_c0_g1~~TRINITY_DN3308_c0_g1_i1.p1  ORF type:complete len:448 (-),score=66.73 TRINITY_DN3308_c0_g1_i1:222-1565(-)
MAEQHYALALSKVAGALARNNAANFDALAEVAAAYVAKKQQLTEEQKDAVITYCEGVIAGAFDEEVTNKVAYFKGAIKDAKDEVERAKKEDAAVHADISTQLEELAGMVRGLLLPSTYGLPAEVLDLCLALGPPKEVPSISVKSFYVRKRTAVCEKQASGARVVRREDLARAYCLGQGDNPEDPALHRTYCLCPVSLVWAPLSLMVCSHFLPASMGERRLSAVKRVFPAIEKEHVGMVENQMLVCSAVEELIEAGELCIAPFNGLDGTTYHVRVKGPETLSTGVMEERKLQNVLVEVDGMHMVCENQGEKKQLVAHDNLLLLVRTKLRRRFEMAGGYDAATHGGKEEPVRLMRLAALPEDGGVTEKDYTGREELEVLDRSGTHPMAQCMHARAMGTYYAWGEWHKYNIGLSEARHDELASEQTTGATAEDLLGMAAALSPVRPISGS